VEDAIVNAEVVTGVAAGAVQTASTPRAEGDVGAALTAASAATPDPEISRAV